MTGEKLTFREVLENFPQYTSKNQFSIFENFDDDFPSLHRASYRNKLIEGKKKKIFVPEKKGKISIPRQPEKFSAHYSQHKINSEPLTPLQENFHRVTEDERVTAMQAAASHETEMMENDDSFRSLNDTMIEVKNTQDEQKPEMTENKQQQVIN